MPEHFYVYPEYLTAASRQLGRRVPKAPIDPNVTLDDLENAARKLGFTVEREDKHYPRDFHNYRGRLKVTKKKGVSKAAFLKKLAAELRTMPKAA
jgi:signal recognition particle subunit SEC65